MAAQQNKILSALGSSLRISDDETKDDTWNGTRKSADRTQHGSILMP